MSGTQRAVRNILRLAFGVGLLAALTVHPGAARGQETSTPGLDVDKLLRGRNSRLDSLLNPQSTRFDSTGIDALVDSLDRGGFDAVRHHRPDAFQPQRLALEVRPGALSAYNRIEGVRYGSGLTLRYGRRASLEAAGAYGSRDHRWGGRGALSLGRKARGPRLEFGYQDLVLPFGPEAELPPSPFLNLLVGQDRQDHLRRREFSASLWPVRRREWAAGLQFFSRRDAGEVARTEYSLIRPHGRPIESPNPAVDAATTRGVEAVGRMALREDLIRLRARVGVGGGALQGDHDWNWQAAELELRPVFPDGGVLSLRVGGLNTSGRPAVQDAAYLGGDANLRGYDRLRFAGRRRLTLRAEYALGIDFFARTRLPWVRSLHLQFIPFVDAGSTWGVTRAVAGAAAPLDGELRSSVGLGLKRDLWFPGAEAVRLDIVHRNDGRGDPWSFWFRFVSIE